MQIARHHIGYRRRLFQAAGSIVILASHKMGHSLIEPEPENGQRYRLTLMLIGRVQERSE
jgi:hypothetical protein